MVWLPVLAIFNVRTAVDACDCTRGLCKHRLKVCTGRWLWEKTPLSHRGPEPASVLRLAFQSDALPAELSTPFLFCFWENLMLGFSRRVLIVTFWLAEAARWVAAPGNPLLWLVSYMLTGILMYCQIHRVVTGQHCEGPFVRLTVLCTDRYVLSISYN